MKVKYLKSNDYDGMKLFQVKGDNEILDYRYSSRTYLAFMNERILFPGSIFLLKLNRENINLF